MMASQLIDGRHRVPTPSRAPPNQSVQSVRSSARSRSPEPQEDIKKVLFPQEEMVPTGERKEKTPVLEQLEERERPKSEPHGGGDSRSRRKKLTQEQPEPDSRLQMLQQILREEDGGIDAATSIFSSIGGSRRSRRSVSTSEFSQQWWPGLPAPRPIDWERMDQLSKPRPMLAEGRLAEVLGQQAAVEAAVGADEAGVAPRKPTRPPHIPAIPLRMQERWDNTPPVGRALEELKLLEQEKKKSGAPADKPKAKESASEAPAAKPKPKVKESASKASAKTSPAEGSPPMSPNQTMKLPNENAAPATPEEASPTESQKAGAAGSPSVSPGQTMKLTEAADDNSPRSRSSSSASGSSEPVSRASSRTRSVTGPDDRTAGPETETAGYTETFEGYNTNTFEGYSENEYSDDELKESNDAADRDEDEGLAPGPASEVAPIKADENNATGASYSSFEPDSP